MNLNESQQVLESVLAVTRAFNREEDIGVHIETRIDEYSYWIVVNLHNHNFWGEHQPSDGTTPKDHIRLVMRNVMARLKESKLFRTEYGFSMDYNGTKFQINGYPTEYRVVCEKECYAVTGMGENEKRIPLKPEEPIELEKA